MPPEQERRDEDASAARPAPIEEQPSLDFGPPATKVREATLEDRDAICAAIGRAFFDDPIAIYLMPDDDERRDRYGVFASLAIESMGSHAMVTVTEPVRGAAIWSAPEPPSLGFWSQMRMLYRYLRLSRRGIGRSMALNNVMRENHYTEPHWYLAILGTEPEAQGRGLGSAMLAPALGHCDRDGVPAYLESSKESNIPFYNRHGFEVTKEIQIPDGPKLWAMLRPAQ